MRYFQKIAAILFFSTCCQFSACSEAMNKDPRFKRIIEDLEELFRHKVDNEEVLDKNSEFDDEVEVLDFEDSSESSENYPEENGSNEVPAFDETMRNLARQNSDGEETLSGIEQESPDISSAKRQQPVEELLYIRQSDPEAKDPISEVIEKLVQDHSSSDPARVHFVHDVSKPQDMDSEFASDDAGVFDRQIHRDTNNLESQRNKAESKYLDVCTKNNLEANLHQTCPRGPEYEMKFHPQFSDALKRDMDKMTSNVKVEGSKCDYEKNLGPETDVRDRALCPFEWVPSDRNPSRVPEFLFEAQCSCSKPRNVFKRGKRKFYCKEVKRLIPVLWIVDCKNGKNKYKQGWQKVSVSCAPVEIKNAVKLDISVPE